jgi:hypothetical protein
MDRRFLAGGVIAVMLAPAWIEPIAGGLPPERIRVKPHFVDDPGPRPAPPQKHYI